MSSKKMNNEKKSKPHNPEYYQCFELHMKNGDVLELAEDYSIPIKEGIIGDFEEGKQKFLEFGDMIYGYVVPLDQISYIVMTKVEQNPYYIK